MFRVAIHIMRELKNDQLSTIFKLFPLLFSLQTFVKRIFAKFVQKAILWKPLPYR